MLLSIGPLQIGQDCSASANSSRTQALQSWFLHLKILVGFNFGFSSPVVDTLINSPLFLLKTPLIIYAIKYAGSTQTGLLTWVLFPVDSSVPLSRSTAKVTILSESRLAANK